MLRAGFPSSSVIRESASPIAIQDRTGQGSMGWAVDVALMLFNQRLPSNCGTQFYRSKWQTTRSTTHHGHTALPAVLHPYGYGSQGTTKLIVPGRRRWLPMTKHEGHLYTPTPDLTRIAFQTKKLRTSILWHGDDMFLLMVSIYCQRFS